MPTAQKAEIIETMKSQIGAATAVYVIDYQGTNVAKMSDLRKSFKNANSELKIVKNTLSRIAANSAGREGLVQFLSGPTALVICPQDPVKPAKVLTDFAKQHKDLIEIKGGIVEGQAISGAEVAKVAEIPPKEYLLAQMLGAFNSPLAGFVGTLNGILRNLVGVLDAIGQQKEKGN